MADGESMAQGAAELFFRLTTRARIAANSQFSVDADEFRAMTDAEHISRFQLLDSEFLSSLDPKIPGLPHYALTLRFLEEMSAEPGPAERSRQFGSKKTQLKTGVPAKIRLEKALFHD